MSILQKTLFPILFILVILSCSEKAINDDQALKTAPWQEITKKANGTTVNFMMWQGSPTINDYINNYVVPSVKEKYHINLKISGGQGPEIVQLVMGEKQADILSGQVDMVWINGETFFQLRKVDGLWGPFVKQLPNAKLVNMNDPFINTDFQQAVKGMEAPWSINQFAIVYDSVKVENPPKNLPQLTEYLERYPGTFTISNDFTGMTLLKSFMAEIGGSPNSLDGPFDEEKYNSLSKKLWDYINSHKKYFWKEGRTFPKEQSKMGQLYANGELLLVYGFSEGGIEEKVLNGLYPKSTRGYAWENGTIKNSNYLGILYNAPQKAGAMQVIDFLLSPEAQLKKADVNGMNSNTVLDIESLPSDWKEKFKTVAKRQYGPEMKQLEKNAIAEPAPEYMIRLYEDFRTQVIEK
ncbi:putative spermidine/putrescine transport system substrate-binding protein [Pricia antarctica]|uniref:Putative spermidine/putrescine transport system substrate-binding protein n=1 Tax=Pricia antarctica TaxID=641691 RepID=A0A1G6WZ09_9FLAO|nr:ABC transporter substrate-binding protein [Pricia antarctica]SDD71200.1 putative spermidine/putrescine transport system substrate-binding protein [Pricia antarctica]